MDHKKNTKKAKAKKPKKLSMKASLALLNTRLCMVEEYLKTARTTGDKGAKGETGEQGPRGAPGEFRWWWE